MDLYFIFGTAKSGSSSPKQGGETFKVANG